MKKETTVLGKQFSEDTKPKMTVNKTPHEYINNPFFIALRGLEWLFNHAKSIAIVLLVISLLGAGGNLVTSNFNQSTHTDQKQLEQDQSKIMSDVSHAIQSVSPEQWAIIGIVGLVTILIVAFLSFWIKGATEYTAAHLAKGEDVTIGGALGGSWHRLGSYSWLQILIGIKIFLWSLLLIVPGIIMAVRYSLAGTAFFAEDDLKGNAAIKRSLVLTKGAWITTFASSIVFNVVTLGLLKSLTNIGTNSVLYRQFADTETKPKPHWLSKLTLALILVAIGLLALIIAAVIAFLANSH